MADPVGTVFIGNTVIGSTFPSHISTMLLPGGRGVTSFTPVTVSSGGIRTFQRGAERHYSIIFPGGRGPWSIWDHPTQFMGSKDDGNRTGRGGGPSRPVAPRSSRSDTPPIVMGGGSNPDVLMQEGRRALREKDLKIAHDKLTLALGQYLEKNNYVSAGRCCEQLAVVFKEKAEDLRKWALSLLHELLGKGLATPGEEKRLIHRFSMAHGCARGALQKYREAEEIFAKATNVDIIGGRSTGQAEAMSLEKSLAPYLPARDLREFWEIWAVRRDASFTEKNKKEHGERLQALVTALEGQRHVAGLEDRVRAFSKHIMELGVYAMDGLKLGNFQEAATAHIRSGDALYELGIAYLEERKKQEAKPFFSRALVAYQKAAEVFRTGFEEKSMTPVTAFSNMAECFQKRARILELAGKNTDRVIGEQRSALKHYLMAGNVGERTVGLMKTLGRKRVGDVLLELIGDLTLKNPGLPVNDWMSGSAVMVAGIFQKFGDSVVAARVHEWAGKARIVMVTSYMNAAIREAGNGNIAVARMLVKSTVTFLEGSRGMLENAHSLYGNARHESDAYIMRKLISRIDTARNENDALAGKVDAVLSNELKGWTSSKGDFFTDVVSEMGKAGSDSTGRFWRFARVASRRDKGDSAGKAVWQDVASVMIRIYSAMNSLSPLEIRAIAFDIARIMNDDNFPIAIRAGDEISEDAVRKAFDMKYTQI